MMEYKGYLASVEFDDSVDVLHGRVVNSGPYPIATFEATETHALRREFERSVDEYLEWCQEDGVEPRKSFSGKLNVRLGSELHAAVVTAAKAEQVSINSWIVRVLREAITTPSGRFREGRVGGGREVHRRVTVARTIASMVECNGTGNQDTELFMNEQFHATPYGPH